ncbi:helix-turn-helix transcriptional regulator [Arthrobacter pigmenti]
MSGGEPRMSMRERGALDSEDAAVYLGFARATLKRWRTTGTGPAYVRVGSKIVYRIEDLDAFLRAHRIR